ncbi:LuxR C-terminal-related transcriptional regulator [Brevibacillus ginsengisoli]|uniref:LuxR C-terminal-related transcriptional regulator n=1 Tax=Brevibacillus ginsengisoli TaxID=363854 RepID=UPI003CF8D606
MQTIINDFDMWENRYIVGRQQELSLFSDFLESDSSTNKHIWNLYGTGGIGKSTLLQGFRLLAIQKGALYIQLGSRDFSHTGYDLCKALLQQLTETAPKETDLSKLLESTVATIREISAYRKVIIAFDTFEEMMELETWLREHFLKWLPSRVLVLIAGRQRLTDSWFYSPAWRSKILLMPVKHLTREETLDYLQRFDISEAERMERIWLRSKGHPLTLSLAVAAQINEEDAASGIESDWFGDLAALWLKEVPEKEQRKWVEAAAVLRHFNEEVLSYLLEEEIKPDIFEQLTRFSFVQKTDRGWMFHDLMREATCSQLKQRKPRYYHHLLGRAACYYAEIILEKSGKSSVSWEVVEFYHYVEHSSIRALTNQASGTYYWDTLTDSNLAEAESFIEYRMRNRKSFTHTIIDPHTGSEFQMKLRLEETSYLIQDLDLHAFYDLDARSVMLLRDEAGTAQGLTVVVPLHGGTLPFLERDPILGPYLAHLSSSERSTFNVPPDKPAGWFMRALDYLDQTDPSLSTEGIKLINSYMCNGGILVISPQPNKYVENVFLFLGFEIVPDVTHCHYDGVTPTPFFIIDTRGDKLRKFLSRLLLQSGFNEELGDHKRIQFGSKELSLHWNLLTKREQEVAELVCAGCSNVEIAEKLFISEVTVKKHLSAIFGKLGVKKRSQLITLLIKGNL